MLLAVQTAYLDMVAARIGQFNDSHSSVSGRVRCPHETFCLQSPHQADDRGVRYLETVLNLFLRCGLVLARRQEVEDTRLGKRGVRPFESLVHAVLKSITDSLEQISDAIIVHDTLISVASYVMICLCIMTVKT